MHAKFKKKKNNTCMQYVPIMQPPKRTYIYIYIISSIVCVYRPYNLHVNITSLYNPLYIYKYKLIQLCTVYVSCKSCTRKLYTQQYYTANIYHHFQLTPSSPESCLSQSLQCLIATQTGLIDTLWCKTDPTIYAGLRTLIPVLYQRLVGN